MHKLNVDTMLEIIRNSLKSIEHPHFYKTERGFEGELSSEIRCRIKKNPLFKDLLIEEEYQKKRKKHDSNIRPDIIIHIPFEQSNLPSRRDGNFAIIELGKNKPPKKVFNDYKKLLEMSTKLQYQLAVFININSKNTFLEDFKKEHTCETGIHLHAFAVKLNLNNEVDIIEKTI